MSVRHSLHDSRQNLSVTGKGFLEHNGMSFFFNDLLDHFSRCVLFLSSVYRCICCNNCNSHLVPPSIYSSVPKLLCPLLCVIRYFIPLIIITIYRTICNMPLLFRKTLLSLTFYPHKATVCLRFFRNDTFDAIDFFRFSVKK